MLFTLEGNFTLVSFWQSTNAPFPMLVTPEGIVTFVTPRHFSLWNASLPMLVTEYPPRVDGIEISVIEESGSAAVTVALPPLTL